MKRKTYRVRFAPEGTECMWCDRAPATYAVSHSHAKNWTDLACEWHMRNMFAEIKSPRLRATMARLLKRGN
jgi:hypothetical protein